LRTQGTIDIVAQLMDYVLLFHHGLYGLTETTQGIRAMFISFCMICWMWKMNIAMAFCAW